LLSTPAVHPLPCFVENGFQVKLFCAGIGQTRTKRGFNGNQMSDASDNYG